MGYYNAEEGQSDPQAVSAANIWLNMLGGLHLGDIGHWTLDIGHWALGIGRWENRKIGFGNSVEIRWNFVEIRICIKN